MTGGEDGIDPEALRAFGASVDFGNTASDYATHRAGFPAAFFDMLVSRGFVAPGQSALDLGTGTGTVARGLALRGLDVTALDPSPHLLDEARTLDAGAGVAIAYETGTAEEILHADHSVDVITAGQCWHWFDRPRTAAEALRVLRPRGRIIIAHFDWLPLPGNVVAATEALILRHNPDWAGAGGSGMYPAWLSDLAEAGFSQLETASFDVAQPYSHAGWRGRIQASAGIAASLGPRETDAFDRELAAMLLSEAPQEPLEIPHRVWLATGLKPLCNERG